MHFASKKHVESVQRALDGERGSVDSGDDFDALMRACLIGHTAAVKALLLRGADVNARDHNGWTPLMEAVFAGHAITVQALLERGADVNSKDPAGWTPLMEAASKGHADAVLLLLAHGADVNARSTRGWTALKATPRGSAGIIKLLKQAEVRQ